MSVDTNLLALLVFVLGVGALLFSLGRKMVVEFFAYSRLKASGQTVQATIARLDIRQWRLARFHYVHYTYEVAQSGEASPLKRVQQVSGEHYNKLATGDTVTVCYLPDSPRLSRLWADDRDLTARDEALLGFLLILCMAFVTSGRFFYRR